MPTLMLACSARSRALALVDQYAIEEAKKLGITINLPETATVAKKNDYMISTDDVVLKPSGIVMQLQNAKKRLDTNEAANAADRAAKEAADKAAQEAKQKGLDEKAQEEARKKAEADAKAKADADAQAAKPKFGVRTTSLGPTLTTPTGMTMYIFATNSADPLNCDSVSGCLDFWTPVPPGPIAGPGVTCTIGRIIRKDTGQDQATCNNNPLYTFNQDQKPGDTTGQNTAGFVIAK